MPESSFPPVELRPLIAELVDLLSTIPSIKIAVAETSTGGLISAALLSVPGASKWYIGGTTLYTLDSRQAWAGWGEEQIKTYTGPTKDIVIGLASHVRKTLNATYCIGESGTAGPTSRGNTIAGVVSIAVAAANGKAIGRTVNPGIGNNRERNMVAFAAEALKLLIEVLKGDVTLEKVVEEEDNSARL